ncbi:MAG: (2Fe-2S) ferredoxin domain-containing protein [Bacteroidales bacterium]
MQDKQEIVICLGSSCFSRGNRICMGIIEKFLKDHNLEDKFFFHGSRCFDRCEKGPVLKIGDKIFEGVKPEEVVKILTQSLSIR